MRRSHGARRVCAVQHGSAAAVRNCPVCTPAQRSLAVPPLRGAQARQPSPSRVSSGQMLVNGLAAHRSATGNTFVLEDADTGELVRDPRGASPLEFDTVFEALEWAGGEFSPSMATRRIEGARCGVCGVRHDSALACAGLGGD